MNSKDIGKLGEDAVCNLLERNGYKILERNYCMRGGEIDIIAIKNEFIAFIEVKTRKAGSISSGIEAVNKRKKELIIKTAADYSYKNPNNYQPRFDIAEVTTRNNKVVKLKYICNAFDTTGTEIIF